MTDGTWPKLMRINPIIDWYYMDVWNYLLAKKVPYCKLYDQGYTSLGNKKNTKPNKALAYYTSTDGIEKNVSLSYRPAYELRDSDALERAGRS